MRPAARKSLYFNIMYSEQQMVANPALRKTWVTLYLLGLGPPPLPTSPEGAWMQHVINGHTRYALPHQNIVRDNLEELWNENPHRFLCLRVQLPDDCM